jgi:hypothetical protein
MGPKGEPDNKTNWSTERRPQDKLNSTQTKIPPPQSLLVVRGDEEGTQSQMRQ